MFVGRCRDIFFNQHYNPGFLEGIEFPTAMDIVLSRVQNEFNV